jgi:hypothetical protein
MQFVALLSFIPYCFVSSFCFPNLIPSIRYKKNSSLIVLSCHCYHISSLYGCIFFGYATTRNFQTNDTHFHVNSSCVSPPNSRPCSLKFWTRDDQFLRFIPNVHTKLNLKILDCTPRSVGDLNVQPCTTLCAKRVFHT